MKRLVACIVLAAFAPWIVAAPAFGAKRRPNVVIVMLDDVRADLITRETAPTITRRVIGRGVVFDRAIVPVSLCCPSRASTLTGNHAHTTGVYKGIGSFRDDETIAVWLDDAGYRTGLFGKYLNGYGRGRWAGYVPPGWDRWTAFRQPGFTGYDWFDRAGRLHAGTRYSTSFLARRAERFIESTPRRVPLFLYFAPYSVHRPTEPARRDVGTFAHLEPWRPPSYDVEPHRQPPYLDRDWPAELADRVDANRIAQHETLLSADRAVHAILDALERSGRRRDSVVVVMSDNGFMWGEHRLTGKNAPYDASSRIPLALRYDAAGWRGSRAGVAANIDVAPTVARLARVDHPATDGASLVPMLRTGSGVRDALLLEHVLGSGGIPSFCGIRTRRHLFVRYADGFEELYDYRVDPWELDNIASDDRGFTASFRQRTRALCDPVPPGFAW
jgi:N-acetylglucosamine-6-sulfatase